MTAFPCNGAKTMQLIIEIPHNIQPPKFHLFQHVCLVPKSPTSKSDRQLQDAPPPRTGVIVGMTYITLFQAIVEHYAGFGWEYQVDFYFNAPFEKALGCEEPVQTYDEADLSPFTPQAANSHQQVAQVS
ncbi:hypothetical protein [Pantanalinema sp. GBBB05]|uniref:hypothetical protein n=1 Tax=Pantanalinema sp. GBBB05 TaxID=2604139 RepID=UPI001E02A674|nr:hypothetical protein [Pantanalinema sp. GBBB05]